MANREQLQQEIYMIQQRMAQLEGEPEVKALAYRHMQEVMAAKQAELATRSKQDRPPDPDYEMMKKAIRQLGPPMTRGATYPPTPPSIAEQFSETAKWHKAAIKVFEFMAAQMNMDLFKDDPEATKIFNRMMVAGYRALHDEARGDFS
jgi:hypothetical protein